MVIRELSVQVFPERDLKIRILDIYTFSDRFKMHRSSANPHHRFFTKNLCTGKGMLLGRGLSNWQTTIFQIILYPLNICKYNVLWLALHACG